MWNTILRENKTWANLKDYFQHARQSLRITRGNTMRGMAYQHANILATQVLLEVKVVKECVLQAIEEQQPDENTSLKQHANSATSDNVQIEVVKLLQIMQGTLES